MPSQRGTRKRSLPGPTAKATQERYNSSGTTLQVTDTASRSFNGIQITESEGHPFPAPKGARLEDRGGPFYTRKSYMAVPVTMPRTDSGIAYWPGYGFSFKYRLIAALLAFPTHQQTGTTDDWPPDLSSSDADMDKAGATAIARCEPTNSVADLSTALLETLKDGLPAMIGSSTWKNRTDSLRKKGSGEYLNLQFGIQPLVNDIKDSLKAITKSDQILSQYERDAGRVVRRKYYFPSQTSQTTTNFGSTYPTVFAAGQIPGLRDLWGTGTLLRTRKIVRRQWFSGAFTYALPSGYDSRNRLSDLSRKAEHLFGLDLTPETIWNIGPWSWAVDWFANTGDVIHNLTAFKTNGLIMRYGYMMEHTIVSDTYTFQWDSNPGAKPKVANVVLVTETKKRRPANPFGFGVAWSGLSPFQASIAAALGLNRGRR